MELVPFAAEAIVPFARSVSQKAVLTYAELVAVLPNRLTAPSIREHLDETIAALEEALRSEGGAEQAKAIIVTNFARPVQPARFHLHFELPEDASAAALPWSETLSEVQRQRRRLKWAAPPLLAIPKMALVLERDAKNQEEMWE